MAAVETTRGKPARGKPTRARQGRTKVTEQFAVSLTGAKRVTPRATIFIKRDSKTGQFVPVDAKWSASKPVLFHSLEAAQDAGLLAGPNTEHVSIRVPKALLEAAKEEAGVTSNTDLGILALSTLAQPDPVTAYMKRTRGSLGKGFKLEY